MPEITGTLKPPRLAAPPGAPVEGQMYYDTGTKKLLWWNGTTWVDATGVADPLIINELRTKKLDYNPAGSGDIAMGVSLNMVNNTIYGVPTPTNADWVATKGYVDARAPKTTVATSAPSSPTVGDVWIDTT